ncbi:discoidin domain-containing protein [Marinimicrobium sp. ABcell2]|uniref:discoidin domain-containing protein n=1 Tax=Marinimicrobium sp. ABcell2 TaxID=3069751 RepID=UPI0027B5834E|nr:discoidin domain-containing protein [Marinimicrobium sp. ABcell2]MDQ2076692.1 discoidin domain-containing protein [Marinimicrobium sp. ABcell2]
MAVSSHASTNLALGKEATSSSRETASMDAANAVDGNMASRWSSSRQDNNWIAIDLGEVYTLSGVSLHWEAAFARQYQIQVSNDGQDWTTVRTVTNGSGGLESFSLDATARHIRMNGIERATQWGYSLWEFEVRGTPLLSSTDNIALGKPATGSTSQGAHVAANAFDGDLSTRWSSSYADNNWVAVDLGDSYHVSEVTLHWEAAYGRDYQIQISDDGNSWTTLRTVTNGNGGVDAHNVNGTGRYVRMNGQVRGTRWGYSLWAFEVQGSPAIVNSEDIALGKAVTASSREQASRSEALVTDGDLSTRWASERTDEQWIAIDLGGLYNLNGVTLHWEAAYGEAYDIQVSTDGRTWSTLHSEVNGTGGVDEISLKGAGRYVRMNGHKRGTAWGYSLWAFEVYGEPFEPAMVNLAQEKTVRASSTESQQLHARHAVDGDTSTRWASGRSDNQWLDVDLGAVYNLTGVRLNWEAAFGKSFQVRVSNDGVNWSTVHTTVNGTGGINNIGLNASARHVRMQGLERGTQWGYSLWQMEVFGYDPLNPDNYDSGSNPNDGAPSDPTTPSDPSQDGDVTAPTVPGSFRSSNIVDNSISLRWNASSDDVGVTGYAIYRDGRHLTTVSGTTLTFTDSGLRAGTTYSYAIRARDAAANWSPFTSTLVLTTTSPTVEAPRFTLEWTPPSARENGTYMELGEIGGYEIRYRLVNATSYKTIKVGPKATSHTFADLSGDYQFEIAAYDTDGLYSKFVTIRTK